ncbi:PREDICTED: UDP-glucose 4-epimerase-like [Priapulus caudatus]|uniref:UDP-N-acetylglucosamine 4-epimerase n=1 Tax=Priapulus caudatus TaxID=37621 RepID=A0ABM1E3J5_PRICU|nr:PREDICTED: UDP-glucose 4-epimerase-like [Priapulus caudatus]
MTLDRCLHRHRADNFQTIPECIYRIEEIIGEALIFYEADVLDAAALCRIFKEHEIDCVIHFVGLKCVGESWDIPLQYYQTNIGGTMTLLEAMKQHGVHNLVFSSSCTVYGDPQYLPVDEAHPTGACTNPYGRSKHINELILKDFYAANKDWNIVMLRYFNPVGAHTSGKIGEDPQGVPNNLMPYVAQVAVGRRSHLNIFGDDYDTHDGTGVRDYIHVVDLGKGHVAAIKALENSCGCKVYNLGTGHGYSVLDVVAEFRRTSGRDVAYRITERRDGDVAATYSCPSAAARELGWTAVHGLSDMCAHMWKFQSLNPTGYRSPSVANGHTPVTDGETVTDDAEALTVTDARRRECTRRQASAAARLPRQPIETTGESVTNDDGARKGGRPLLTTAHRTSAYGAK